MKAILLGSVLGIVAGSNTSAVTKIVYAAVVTLCSLVDLLIWPSMAALWDAVWVILAFNAALFVVSIVSAMRSGHSEPRGFLPDKSGRGHPS